MDNDQLIQMIRQGGTPRERAGRYLQDKYFYLVRQIGVRQLRLSYDDANMAFSDALTELDWKIRQGESFDDLGKMVYTLTHRRGVDTIRKRATKSGTEPFGKPGNTTDLPDWFLDVLQNFDKLNLQFKYFCELYGEDVSKVKINTILSTINDFTMKFKESLDSIHTKEAEEIKKKNKLILKTEKDLHKIRKTVIKNCKIRKTVLKSNNNVHKDDTKKNINSNYNQPPIMINISNFNANIKVDDLFKLNKNASVKFNFEGKSSNEQSINKDNSKNNYNKDSEIKKSKRITKFKPKDEIIEKEDNFYN